MIAGIAFVQRRFATGGVSWRRPVNLPCHLPSTEKLYDLRDLWSFLISRHLINLYNQRHLWSFLSSTGGLVEVSGDLPCLKPFVHRGFRGVIGVCEVFLLLNLFYG
jgi:hypothetical protein